MAGFVVHPWISLYAEVVGFELQDRANRNRPDAEPRWHEFAFGNRQESDFTLSAASRQDGWLSPSFRRVTAVLQRLVLGAAVRSQIWPEMVLKSHDTPRERSGMAPLNARWPRCRLARRITTRAVNIEGLNRFTVCRLDMACISVTLASLISSLRIGRICGQELGSPALSRSTIRGH